VSTAPPCRASFPHLVDAQKEFAKTGRFTVIASHVQDGPDKARDFCKENKVNFPVFQQFREPAAPCGNGIPSAFIIDHTGKVVEKGHPTELLKKIGDYVKKAPTKYFMISSTEVKLWASQAKTLAPNKPVLQILNQLKLAAAKDDEKGKEAKAIAEEIESYVKDNAAKIAKSAETAPAQSFLDLQDFLLLVKGMEQEAEMKALSDKLNSDPELAKFIPAVKELRQIRRKIEDKPTKALDKQLAAALKKVEKFKDSKSAIVAAEAESLGRE